jgi:hypothetical protein
MRADKLINGFGRVGASYLIGTLTEATQLDITAR